MALSFPNLSRSYDARRQAVCFWAYDSALEITFFVEVEALRKLWRQGNQLEVGHLQAFDAAREQILAAARKVYARTRPGRQTSKRIEGRCGMVLHRLPKAGEPRQLSTARRQK